MTDLNFHYQGYLFYEHLFLRKNKKSISFIILINLISVNGSSLPFFNLVAILVGFGDEI